MPFNCQEPLLALELTIQEGSCPYLYAWDGTAFSICHRYFGSGAARPARRGGPLYRRRSGGIGLDWRRADFSRPRNGSYELQITEELREVLYLDEAKLVVVDHEPGTEVHSTDKLLPGRPFPRGGLMTLHQRASAAKGRDAGWAGGHCGSQGRGWPARVTSQNCAFPSFADWLSLTD